MVFAYAVEPYELDQYEKIVQMDLDRLPRDYRSSKCNLRLAQAAAAIVERYSEEERLSIVTEWELAPDLARMGCYPAVTVGLQAGRQMTESIVSASLEEVGRIQADEVHVVCQRTLHAWAVQREYKKRGVKPIMHPVRIGHNPRSVQWRDRHAINLALYVPFRILHRLVTRSA